MTLAARTKRFISHNVVMCIAACVAIVTMFLIPPDVCYLEYFDFKTLSCLLSILALVAACRHAHFFDVVARMVLKRFKQTRSVVMALVFVTMVASMFVTNDLALTMFLPLTVLVLFSTNHARLVPFVFVMQSLAANLGGMIMPFGNPQNLYLFSYYHIGLAEFLGIMACPFAISVALIALCCMFVRSEPLTVSLEVAQNPHWKSVGVYAFLFALVLLGLFRIISFWISLVIVAAVLLVMDHKTLKEVDWGLLLTFVFFFIFAGNMARIPEVQLAFVSLFEYGVLFVSAGLSQVISNVPAAVLLAQFTSDYSALLMGVNIGGAGTVIASLASVITLNNFLAIQKYGLMRDEQTAKHFSLVRYLGLFSALNFLFLFVLLVACSLL